MWALLCGACVGAPDGPTRPERASSLAQDLGALHALAARGPAGADRCTWALPMRVPMERRAAYTQLSAVPAFVFDPALQVSAYIDVTRQRGGGARGRVVLLRVGAAPAVVRSRLSQHAGWDIRWSAIRQTCSPDACPTQAQFVDTSTVRLQQGPWLSPATARGVQGACREASLSAPEAVEWTAQRGQMLRIAAAKVLPRWSSRTVFLRPGRVYIERRHRLPHADLARDLRDGAASAQAPGAAPYERVLARVARGPDLLLRSELLWEDLQLLQADAARLAAVEAQVQQWLDGPVDAPPDFEDRDALLAQVGYLWGRAAVVPQDRRVAVEAALLRLLRGAVAHLPADPEFARLLAQRLLRGTPQVGLSAAAEAVAVTAPHRADAELGPAIQGLHLEALARSDTPAFAQALVERGVAARAQAPAAAHAIAGLLRQHHAYTAAEAAWQTRMRLRRAGRATRVQPLTTTVELPWASLPEGLLALRQLGGGDRAPLQLWLERPAAGGGRVASEPPPVGQAHGRYRFDDGVLFEFDRSDTAAARAAGQALALSALRGPVRLVIPVGYGIGRVIVLQGHSHRHALQLAAADPVTAQLPLPAIAEHLLRPLDELRAGGFHLPLTDPAAVGRKLQLASSAYGLPCVPTHDGLRCRAEGALLGRARAAVVGLAAADLTAAAQRMWALSVP